MKLAAAIAAYLGALLAIDTQVALPGQLLLGASTWAVLLLVALRLPPERRAQIAVVVCAATLAEVTGSILWGVYSYRLHNLPTFVPPAHGLVFVAGLSLSEALRRHARTLVWGAAAAASTWGLLGLTVLPRRDAAGALGVPLLVAFLWRSRARAAYAGVFLVVAALELYGTAIGTWRWAPNLPGIGVPDGNPPSGVASGYVWFDVMAMLLAPAVLRTTRTFLSNRPTRISKAADRRGSRNYRQTADRWLRTTSVDSSRDGGTMRGTRAQVARRDDPRTGECVIELEGRLHHGLATALSDELHRAIDGGRRQIVVDLGRSTLVDSTALGVVLAARNHLAKSGGDLRVVVDDGTLLTQLKVFGLDRLLRVYRRASEPVLATAASAAA